MNKLFAVGLACCLPTGLAAGDPSEQDYLPVTVSVLVIEDSAPLARDVLCTRGASEQGGAECTTVHRAVLTARMQKVSVRERGTWM